MPGSTHIIVILTTDKAAFQGLRSGLEQAGYRVLFGKDLEKALADLGKAIPALVLLHRPDYPLQHLPRDPALSDILFMSLWPNVESCTEEQYLEDFEAGIDDVVSQQTTRQIVARVRALLRRRHVQAPQSQRLSAGPLRMDLDRHEVTVNGRLIDLTPKEFAILQCFLRSPGSVFSRQDMLNRVWGDGYALEEHALDVHIHALRHKIESNPARPTVILTVRGLGYKLKTR